MSNLNCKSLRRDIEVGRELGHYAGDEGPVVIFIAGVHGNEPSGICALKNVLELLHKNKPHFKGKLYAFSGNLMALSQNERYIEKDLNRIWLDERLEAIQTKAYPERLSMDSIEQIELFHSIEKVLQENKQRQVYMFDLHTTSGKSKPFATIGDTLRNRSFVLQFPLPIILGIDEQIEGSLLNYYNWKGYTAVGFEGGQHDDEESIQNHTVFVWLALCFSGCLNKDSFSMFSRHYSRLENSTIEHRKIFEVRFRYDTKDNEDFAMLPEFKNFQTIKRGQVLATNSNGEIKANQDGRMFMPLYQKQGSDGFFIVREIRPFWLQISEGLRKTGFDQLLPLLPGIKRSTTDNNTLVVNLKIARWYVIEFFHLMGYRKKKRIGKNLVFTKRKYDLLGPEVQCIAEK